MYFPLLVKDPERPFGQNNCSQCQSQCSGHYLKSGVLVEKAINGQQPLPMQPPSDVLVSVYKKYKNIPPDDVIRSTSENVLLPPEETRMWFEHLHQVSLNRQKGARKAASTRSKKTKDNQAVPKNTNDNICASCGKEEPAEKEDHSPSSIDVNWVACDGCLSWYHVECVVWMDAKILANFLTGYVLTVQSLGM